MLFSEVRRSCCITIFFRSILESYIEPPYLSRKLSFTNPRHIEVFDVMKKEHWREAHQSVVLNGNHCAGIEAGLALLGYYQGVNQIAKRSGQFSAEQ